MLQKMHLISLNQIALATHKAYIMMGHYMGSVARMRAKVPTLINIYFFVHRESLVVGDATRAFLGFQMLDHFANKVYEWVGYSTNRRNELEQLLKDVFEDYVVVYKCMQYGDFLKVMSEPA